MAVAVVDREVRDLAVVQDEMDEIERVFRRYSPRISYFFAHRGFSPEDCRDLTQETFLRALNGIEGFRGDANLETWLLRIATNVWKNRIRSKRAAKRNAPETSLGSETDQGEGSTSDRLAMADRRPSPEAELLARERSRLLREAIDELPKRMKRCVILRIQWDLKYREIAAIMQVSVDTVKTQLYQARQRLKDVLQGNIDLDLSED